MAQLNNPFLVSVKEAQAKALARQFILTKYAGDMADSIAKQVALGASAGAATVVAAESHRQFANILNTVLNLQSDLNRSPSFQELEESVSRQPVLDRLPSEQSEATNERSGQSSQGLSLPQNSADNGDARGGSPTQADQAPFVDPASVVSQGGLPADSTPDKKLQEHPGITKSPVDASGDKNVFSKDPLSNRSGDFLDKKDPFSRHPSSGRQAMHGPNSLNNGAGVQMPKQGSLVHTPSATGLAGDAGKATQAAKTAQTVGDAGKLASGASKVASKAEPGVGEATEAVRQVQNIKKVFREKGLFSAATQAYKAGGVIAYQVCIDPAVIAASVGVSLILALALGNYLILWDLFGSQSSGLGIISKTLIICADLLLFFGVLLVLILLFGVACVMPGSGVPLSACTGIKF